MPKGFSDEEHAVIEDQLLSAGEALFSQHDFSKVSIDEVVSSVGISKGAFYSFFQSKEAFFFEVTQHVEAREKREIERRLTDRWDQVEVRELLEQFFREQFELLIRVPLFERAIDPALFKRVVRKVSKRRYQESMTSDERFWNEWTARFVQRGMSAEPRTQRRAFESIRSLFYLALHRVHIGPDWQEHVNYLIALVARDLTEADDA